MNEKEKKIIQKTIYRNSSTLLQKNRHCRSLSVCAFYVPISFYPSMLTVHGMRATPILYTRYSARNTEQSMCTFGKYIGREWYEILRKRAYALTHAQLEKERIKSRSVYVWVNTDGCLLPLPLLLVRLGTTKIVLYHTKEHRFLGCNGKMYSPAKKPIENIYSCAFGDSVLCRQLHAWNISSSSFACFYVRILFSTAQQCNRRVSISCFYFVLCSLVSHNDQSMQSVL